MVGICLKEMNFPASFQLWEQEKSLPDSNQGCTVLAARTQPLSRPGRQSQRRQSGLKHCHDGASSDRQSMIISIWHLCAIKRLSESKRFFTWWHFLTNHLLRWSRLLHVFNSLPSILELTTSLKNLGPLQSIVFVSFLNQGKFLESDFAQVKAKFNCIVQLQQTLHL